jgi:hypothetical protein
MSARQPMHRGAGFILLPVVLLLALIAAMAYLGNRESGVISAMGGGATDMDKARYAAEAGLHRAIVKMHGSGCGGSYPIYLLSPAQDNGFDGGKYNAYAFPWSGSPVSLTSTGTFGDASITLTRQNVPMHQSTGTTITLQPAAEGIDTYLKDTGGNYSTSDVLLARPGTSYPLIQFDLTAIPAGSHVTAATLSAYAIGGGGSGPVALHRVSRDWTEAATWTTTDGGTAWSQPGGDAHPDAVASAPFTVVDSWMTWDVTALADKWVNGSLPNQGLQVRVGAGISSLSLVSSDSSNPSQRLKLAVTFQPTCGWAPPDATVTLSPQTDTDIDFNIPTTNFGSQPDLYLSQGYPAHPLLQFDLAGINAGSNVKSATLRLYFGALNVNTVSASKTTKNLTLNVHAVTKSWKELEATWKKRLVSSNWTTQGGDYRSTSVTSMTLSTNSTPGTWLEFDVRPLVQEWVDGVTANNGLILETPTSSTEELIFNSREAASNPPELVVTYK